ncbi:TPA: hypothetical protein QHN36_003542 [Enterobacter bugandensis]|nr:hypothetical protein [Enterobacter bugandensis]
MSRAIRGSVDHIDWLRFKYTISGFLLGQGLAPDVQTAIEFADSLDLSYEQEYKKTPFHLWGPMMQRDADELRASLEKFSRETKTH